MAVIGWSVITAQRCLGGSEGSLVVGKVCSKGSKECSQETPARGFTKPSIRPSFLWLLKGGGAVGGGGGTVALESVYYVFSRGRIKCCLVPALSWISFASYSNKDATQLSPALITTENFTCIVMNFTDINIFPVPSQIR